MKKLVICIVTAAIAATCFTGTGFAADNNKLSLNDAIRIMQTTGTRAETAELNKKSDQAIAAGYSEAVKTISETLNDLALIRLYQPSSSISYSAAAESAGATAVNEKVSKLRRDFAKEQIDKNYKAEMNQIEYDTVQAYYGVLLAQDNLITCQDNLKAQLDILKNTNAKFKVGMLAKKDVLSAESAVTSAMSDIRNAQTKLDYAKMGFNFLLGYPVTQDTILSDTLKEVTAPAIDIEGSVKSAVANRNEIQGVKFAAEVHGILLSSLQVRYPKNSSTYLKQQATTLEAQKSVKDAPSQIEIEIRNKAAELGDKKAALDAAKSTREYAQEGYRLISLSYDAGLATLAEVQEAQVNVYKAGLGVSQAISDYDLAVYAFKYAQDVGVNRLPL
ncbi:TolC family protein [Sinanaerobacter chloroacetimidivorans]|jgi:hypothetical protein|uniref:TolC family protein n=1 Tax=Sinanaerobacter chloroacetimidivorans TaxID=2818044 RepID=A0A8J7W1N8_9FIRM|nr:TolC family protein [Sinanaerobacter chloroacetimidivorans]MBR0599189.1 TolC family protein [Sinanaerobacter chloroacetimidivorans]